MAIVGLVLLDCLRQPVGHDARARRRAPARDCRAPGHGRLARRLARQLLTETALLFAGGCVLGVLLSAMAARAADGAAAATARAARHRHAARRPRADVRDRALARRRHRVGARAGAAGVAARSCAGAQDRRRDGRRPAASAQRVPRRPGGHVAAAGAHRGTLHARARSRHGHITRASTRPTSTSRCSTSRWRNTTRRRGPASRKIWWRGPARGPACDPPRSSPICRSTAGAWDFGELRTPGLQRGDSDEVNADWNVGLAGLLQDARFEVRSRP